MKNKSPEVNLLHNSLNIALNLDILEIRVAFTWLHGYMLFLFADGYVIGHYANNARDFLYPAVPPYPGSGREVTLFKTSLFNPIRITVSTTCQFRFHRFM